MNSKQLIRIFLAILVMVSSCSPALYTPSMTDSDQTGISVDRLITGRTLYIQHCGSCHNLHLPERFTLKQWEKVMPEMKKKAKIPEDETQLITDFVLAHCNSD